MKDDERQQTGAGKMLVMLRDEAFVVLERMIVTGEIAPGEWVSETQLMSLSGHSRASVRSAMQRLQDQGLLEIFPRRGAQVCPLDFKMQFRSLELRRALECLLARAAAERATPEQRAEFIEIAEGFAAVSLSLDAAAMRELDFRSHALMLDAADNPFASKAVFSTKGLWRRFWLLHYEKHGDIFRMANLHSAVARAIGEQDPTRAEAAVHALLDYVEEFALKVVGYDKAAK
ncbi:GntR family transcriptional regulator [Salipiger sp. P9]|uniref:GntR family transcriptional regulator n=1 Tax=Salipiger pentaromativorans TaxID=2943193 RepID=UPI002157B394|nr:GntR family transcriptional regulator [Salipiger pentaromativorans]MCR8549155.1 GntR family transcriptional regulator [Salipiger pentaromativorans]